VLKRKGEEMATVLNGFLYDHVIPQLPKKWMSHWVGKAAHVPWPQTMNRRMVKVFARHYQIDLSEIEKPIEDYSTLGEFFSRKLKPGVRPIMGEVIHPCDGTLIESGRIHDALLIQAKGKSYKVDEFLPDNPWREDFLSGSFFTYYLAPHNYHRVHAPVSGQVKWSTLVPGELWPVNSWSVKNIKDLYAVNERVIAGIECGEGKRAIVVMVGATNVGSMSVSFDQNIKTNNPRKKEKVFRQYDRGRPLQVGDEFGIFHLGSTVVVLYNDAWKLGYRERCSTLMGQSLSST
jgi:phosphatidylserine decarboxylase